MSAQGDISNDENVTQETCVTEVFLGSTKDKSDITLTLQTKSTEKKIVAVHQQRTVSSLMGGFQETMQQQNVSHSKEFMTSSVTSQVQNVKSFNLTKLGGSGKISVEHITKGEIEEGKRKPTAEELDNAKKFYENLLYSAIKDLKGGLCGDELLPILNRINEIIRNAWEVPAHGHILGEVMCNILLKSGALEFILQCLEQPKLQKASAMILEQCLTPDNRDYVLLHGIEILMSTANSLIKNSGSVESCRIGTGILESLCKSTLCGSCLVVEYGGLGGFISACSKTDKEILLHCASGLANLCLCGSSQNIDAISSSKVIMWLTPLAHHEDVVIKYYSCFAMASLLRYKEFRPQILQSNVLDDVESFLAMVTPEKFVELDSTHIHGQGREWLEYLLILLRSDVEKAQTMSAFHFCVEALIKKSQGDNNFIMEIENSFETLKDVASGSNPVAAKYATETLWVIMSSM